MKTTNQNENNNWLFILFPFFFIARIIKSLFPWLNIATWNVWKRSEILIVSDFYIILVLSINSLCIYAFKSLILYITSFMLWLFIILYSFYKNNRLF